MYTVVYTPTTTMHARHTTTALQRVINPNYILSQLSVRATEGVLTRPPLKENFFFFLLR